MAALSAQAPRDETEAQTEYCVQMLAAAAAVE